MLLATPRRLRTEGEECEEKRLLALGLMATVLVSVPVQARDTPAYQPIRLQVATFDPLRDPVQRTIRPVTEAPPYAIVQFDSPLSEAQSAQAALLGIAFLGYIPENAYVARLTPETTARLAQLGGVRWIGPYLAEYKIAPPISKRQVTASAAPIVVETIGFPGESASALANAVSAAGGSVLLTTDTPIGPLVRAQIAATAIAQIAAIDGVA